MFLQNNLKDSVPDVWLHAVREKGYSSLLNMSNDQKPDYMYYSLWMPAIIFWYGSKSLPRGSTLFFQEILNFIQLQL